MEAPQTPPVLTLPGLAGLLGVPVELAETLVIAHGLPHVRIGRSPRFLTGHVLAWLERLSAPGGAELLPAAGPEGRAEPPFEVPPLPSATPGEVRWLEPAMTDVLSAAEADPTANLARLRLRDALLELHDGVLPLLGRLSQGLLRADPEERTRTSAWRIERADEPPITAMSLVWAAQPLRPGQPTLEVRLRAGLLELVLDLGSRPPAAGSAEIEPLAAAGLRLEGRPEAEGGLSLEAVVRTHAVPVEGVTLAGAVRALTPDLSLLVPLWLRAAGQGAGRPDGGSAMSSGFATGPAAGGS